MKQQQDAMVAEPEWNLTAQQNPTNLKLKSFQTLGNHKIIKHTNPVGSTLLHHLLCIIIFHYSELRLTLVLIKKLCCI